jgi:geranylgeranyl diphosphate synthase type I
MGAPPPRDAAPLPAALAELGEQSVARITTLLDGELVRWTEVDADLVPPLQALRDLVTAGGKRLRPAFCHWAFVGAGGDPADPVVVDVGAALELLHAFALVHDDVMDGSDTRRGEAAVHRRFADRHQTLRARGEARRFGEGAAILVGDFAFVYSDMLFATAPPAARPLFDELRIELCVGQFLDLAAGATGARERKRAELIERYKSGKYTVERPLHLGAALAGRADELAAPLSAYGVPIGQAFQLRDDLLGVFGDPEVTGKPVGEDLRERKLTPLVAAAVARDPGLDAELDTFGLDRPADPDRIEAIQERLVASGAVDEVEASIATLVDTALAALATAPITAEAKDALVDLGRFVAWRDR